MKTSFYLALLRRIAHIFSILLHLKNPSWEIPDSLLWNRPRQTVAALRCSCKHICIFLSIYKTADDLQQMVIMVFITSQSHSAAWIGGDGGLATSCNFFESWKTFLKNHLLAWHITKVHNLSYTVNCEPLAKYINSTVLTWKEFWKVFRTFLWVLSCYYSLKSPYTK